MVFKTPYGSRCSEVRSVNKMFKAGSRLVPAARHPSSLLVTWCLHAATAAADIQILAKNWCTEDN